MNVPQPLSPQQPTGLPDGPDTSPGRTSDKAPGATVDNTTGKAAPVASRRISAGVMGWVAVLFVFVGAMTLWGAWKLYQRTTDGAADSTQLGATGQSGAPVPGADVPWLDEFTLTERTGKPFNSADLAGKVWVASFFFATCPSYCVQQNQRVQQLAAEYADQDVTFVSITCDPKQDTPEKLREYARRFDADPQRWLFLTGDLTYIRRVGAEKFGVPVHEQTHKNSLMVVDKWGKVLGSFDWNDEKEMREFQEALRAALAAKEPPEETDPTKVPAQSGEANETDEPEDGGESDVGKTPPSDATTPRLDDGASLPDGEASQPGDAP
jgi:protein SCO1/2